PRRPPSFPTRRSSDLPLPLLSLDSLPHPGAGMHTRHATCRRTICSSTVPRNAAAVCWTGTAGTLLPSPLPEQQVAHAPAAAAHRSEEHTSELQSRENL